MLGCIALRVDWELDVLQKGQKRDVPPLKCAVKELPEAGREISVRVLQGVRAVLAESYEKIHKDHLIGIGIAPLQFLPGENAESLGLTGRETFSLAFPEELSPGVTLTMKVSLSPGVGRAPCVRGDAAREAPQSQGLALTSGGSVSWAGGRAAFRG